MSSAYGIKAIKPTDAEHVLGFASARSTSAKNRSPWADTRGQRVVLSEQFGYRW